MTFGAYNAENYRKFLILYKAKSYEHYYFNSSIDKLAS